MSVQIRPLDASNAAAWDAYVLANPAGTFCHRAAWAEVLHRAFGHRSHYVLTTQDGAITGVLPLAEVRSVLFGHRLISTPFCVYGGPLAEDRESFAALIEAATQLQRVTGATALELRFREPPPQDWCDPADWSERADQYATFRRPITASDDDNLKAIPRKQRAVVRKALTGALHASVTRDTDALHRIYAESVRNLGTPVFPRRYFRLLAEAFGPDMDVLSISSGGQVQAAVMNFHFRDEVLPYYGGGTREARATGANDLMYWEVMRQAAAAGARLFDFGRSKANSGAYAFKKNWGFPAAPLTHRFHLRAGAALPDNSPTNPKYKLMIDTWKRLPLPLANALGPLIVRGTG
jgi:FemAB-related protein (PEP-CTERM system-associated)